MNSGQGPLVSVVTPVFNGEEHLRECIESVLAQTYGNWDYVIVDNCSTDRTLEIAQEYAARDPRIRVHRNETFVRVHANHNIALRLISPTAKYAKVAQADDWLYPECLERMVQLAEANPTVAIVQAYRHQGSAVAGDGIPYRSTVLSGRDACRLWLLPGRPSMFGAPTSVLYRSDIVRSRHDFYNESNISADTEVCLEFLEHADYGFVHQVLTFQRLRPGSVMTHMTRLRTDLPARLYELVTYGPKYLEPDELAHAIEDQLRGYYQALGREALQRRDKEFWALHRSKLASLGYPMSRRRIAMGAIRYILDLVVNPGLTWQKLVGRRRSDH
jgi:glycosyltransferase involved in cell wall biosynthesis